MLIGRQYMASIIVIRYLNCHGLLHIQCSMVESFFADFEYVNVENFVFPVLFMRTYFTDCGLL